MFKWAISQNVAHLNILVHDVINSLYYEYWTDRQKYFYECVSNIENFVKEFDAALTHETDALKEKEKTNKKLDVATYFVRCL